MIPTLEPRAIACNYSKFCKEQGQARQPGSIFPRLDQKMAADKSCKWHRSLQADK